jgi:hypothetical protein
MLRHSDINCKRDKLKFSSLSHTSICTIHSSYNISEIDVVITSEYLNLLACEFHTYPMVACTGNNDTTDVSILYFGALKYLQYVLISVDSHSLNY